MTSMPKTIATHPQETPCPAWCDGIEQHYPLTYADDQGTHARQHTRRAGGWLLSSYSLTTGEGAMVPDGTRIEWAPSVGKVGSPEAERDHLASLFDLCPAAASPTLADMDKAGQALGLDHAGWVDLLDGVTVKHPRQVTTSACPPWCSEHGQQHNVSRDLVEPDAAATIRHEWRQNIGTRTWVSLTRYDWPDEQQPTTEIIVEDGGEGLNLEDARALADAILEAIQRAEGTCAESDDLTLADIARTAVALGLRPSHLFALSEQHKVDAPRADRCNRCGAEGDAAADGWFCTMRAGIVTEFVCPNCQTPVERAEATRNAEQVAIMGTNAEGQVLGIQRQAPVRVVLDLDPAGGGRDWVCVERDGGLSNLEVLRAARDAIAAASDTVRGVWS